MNQSVLYIVSGDLWGGAESQVLYQAEALKSRGCDIKLLLFNHGALADRLAALGIEHYVCPELKDQGHGRISAHLCHLYDSLREIRRISPSLINTHGYKEGMLAFLAWLFFRIPWVSTFHGACEKHKGWAAAKMFLYSRVHLRLSGIFARRIICVSKALSETLGFNKLEKTRIVYNSIPNSLLSFSKNQLPKLHKPALVIIGRLVPVKRVDICLQAFALLSSQQADAQSPLPHLYILGDGIERQELETLASSSPYSENIHFLGFIEAVEDYLATADVLIVSSDSEGIPTVILQAMAMGLPVATSRVGGIPEVFELVPDYPAALVPAGKPEALAESLKILLNEECDSHRRNSNGDYPAVFTAQYAAKTLQEIFVGCSHEFLHDRKTSI